MSESETSGKHAREKSKQPPHTQHLNMTETPKPAAADVLVLTSFLIMQCCFYADKKNKKSAHTRTNTANAWHCTYCFMRRLHYVCEFCFLFLFFVKYTIRAHPHKFMLCNIFVWILKNVEFNWLIRNRRFFLGNFFKTFINIKLIYASNNWIYWFTGKP